MATYKNPWCKKGYGPLEFTSTAEPVEYKGYLIYMRPDIDTGFPVWDVVRDGACVTQRAGLDGAKRAVDELCELCFPIHIFDMSDAT